MQRTPTLPKPRHRDARSTALASLLALALASAATQAAEAACDRNCLSGLVNQLLASMPAHAPDRLPLTATYAATENSHPAALGMMSAWRSITQTGRPAMSALDPQRGQAYFALPVRESGARSLLWGRIQVQDRRISELEIFINRSRGDHGFSFSADQAARHYARWMKPPADRLRASRESLERLARAAFDASDPYQIEIAADCQFNEAGSLVIDPGLDDEPARPNAHAPLGCLFPPFRPTDKNYRIISVDEEMGIVVIAAIVPGVVYPYPLYGRLVSAFIPSDMKEAQQAQDAWLQRKRQASRIGLLTPMQATGDTFQVLQVYDGRLQGLQINLMLSGPGLQSLWAASGAARQSATH